MSSLDFSGVRAFDFLLGRWRVAHHQLAERLTGSTDWQMAHGIDIVRPAFLGLGNIGCFRRQVNGFPYEGVPLRLYDPRSALWSIYWLDTIGQRMEPPVIGRFENGCGEFLGDDVFAGRAIRVRFRWREITPISARWEQAYSPDAGATWELNSIMEFSRDDSIIDHRDVEPYPN